MTSEQLNAWYHKEIMGKASNQKMCSDAGFDPKDIDICIEDEASDQPRSDCTYLHRGGTWKDCSHKYAEPIPDYLSDPAVVLGIIVDLINSGHDLYKGAMNEFIIAKIRPDGVVAHDKDLPRAVFLALKKKMEADGE